jgi:hypothetical protein
MRPAQLVDPGFARPMSTVVELVGDEAVAEARIVPMDVDDGVHEMGIVPVPLGHRIPEPLVEGLGREAEHPTGHRHGSAFVGKVTDQRELHFGSRSLAK